VSSAVAHGAAIMADELGARAIVVCGDTGDAALRVSKAHPATPIIAATHRDSVARRMALLSGVVPLQVSQGRDSFHDIAIARRAALASGLIRNGDRVVVLTTSPAGPAVYADLVGGRSILDYRSESR